jgi:methyl-accepting chemotaxis protein
MIKLKDLSLGKKLAIIVISMLAPSVWLLYSTVSTQQRTIESAELKLQGLDYLQALWTFSGHVADHRGLANSRASKVPADVAIVDNKVAAADAMLAEIKRLEASVDPAMRIGADWAPIEKQWTQLKTRDNGLDATLQYRGHSAVLDQLAKFNERVATRSTLLFESEEAAHFLIDAVTAQIPHTQNDIFLMRRAVASAATAPATPTPMPVALYDLIARMANVRASAVSMKASVKRLQELAPEASDKLGAAAESYASAAETYVKFVEQLYTGSEGKLISGADLKPGAPRIVTDLSLPTAVALFRASSELQNLLIPILRETLQARSAQAMWTRNALLIGYLLLIGVALTLERVLRKQIDTSAKTMVASMERMANGEIGHQVSVSGEDEFGKALSAVNRLDKKLAEVVAVIRSTADTVGSEAREISHGNDELSSRTQSQASALQQTASSMEQMTATVKQNADNARQANELASGMRQQAERGSEVVNRAAGAMSEINSSSSKIGDIIGVIDSIAFQTNLLALNAAVEAARAGEQGRGFAVVATEVRNLAQRSAGAAKDIRNLIKDSVDKVQAGSELVNESGKMLAEILGSVRKVSDIVSEIAAASLEQSAGIEQVNNAVAQMDAVTQENAARVDQASTASKSMQQQAEKLVQQITYFVPRGTVRHVTQQTDTDTDAEAA